MSDPTRKMSLLQATMLVAGNMIGTGVFLLPVNLASVGGIAILGFLVATAGAAALGLIFAKLGELDPQEGGPYAYARDFLGPYVGFQTNYVYWFGNWIGNIAVAVAAVGYLAEFFPRISGPPASVFATAVVIWVLTFANILGPRVVGALETWTMSLAIVPILGIAFLGWLWFDSATFFGAWNVSGGSGLHAVSRSASMALWAYMGIESAAVSAGVIENPKRNIPLATLMGLGLSAVVYILSSSVIMGIIPNAELRTSHAPFAEAARLAVGTWGMVVISVCAILKSLGSLGGWMLLDTPAIEYTDALGKFLPDQDRPNESVFSFKDDDEQWLSLRYDLTAPLARYVAENYQSLPKPFRRYQVGPVWRNEKPGPGRFRQFTQFDADTVGASSVAADAELCMLAADTLEALGVPRGQYVVKVSSRKLLDGFLRHNRPKQSEINTLVGSRLCGLSTK